MAAADDAMLAEFAKTAGKPITCKAAVAWSANQPLSDETVVVEGNHYFPPSGLREAHLRPSEHRTACPWKGTAGYFDVVVGDEVNPNAAWVYRDPTSAAAEIRDHVAFWMGVQVRETEG